jgi:hypothetical protein
MKEYSGRDPGFLLPALAATASAQSSSQPAADNSVEKLPVMKTKTFLYNELPVNTNGQNRQRRMFTAKTHTGC